MQALLRLSIASVISNQYIATKFCISIGQILLSTFPLSQQWFHVNMRKKKKKNVLKNMLLPVWFQRRHRPKAVDQSQRLQP